MVAFRVGNVIKTTKKELPQMNSQSQLGLRKRLVVEKDHEATRALPESSGENIIVCESVTSSSRWGAQINNTLMCCTSHRGSNQP
ncbi:Uncharacterized protein TCM_014174 [Theobroma cacao]|uniref:Uncharacterized protein n=1 Tax=Theobroma cacao TaxID=3641 RepID=A0A061FXM1_THECC|nr:Uncharacterized protein TCM_014174 [Theobroma cacao]